MSKTEKIGVGLVIAACATIFGLNKYRDWKKEKKKEKLLTTINQEFPGWVEEFKKDLEVKEGIQITVDPDSLEPFMDIDHLGMTVESTTLHFHVHIDDYKKLRSELKQEFGIHDEDDTNKGTSLFRNFFIQKKINVWINKNLGEFINKKLQNYHLHVNWDYSSVF